MLFPISRVLIPAICLVLAGFPITPALWGAFRGFPPRVSYARSCLFIVPNIFGYPCAPRTQPRRNRPNSIAIFSENGDIICIYAKIVVTLRAKLYLYGKAYDIEFIDCPDGNQFVARIWRTTQKDENTTQKANEGLNTTTQKKDSTTQKPLNTTQKRILDYLKNYPKATRQEVAIALGDITEDGVKFNIGLLQQYGVLQRKGGRKEGEWVVLID